MKTHNPRDNVVEFAEIFIADSQDGASTTVQLTCMQCPVKNCSTVVICATSGMHDKKSEPTVLEAFCRDKTGFKNQFLNQFVEIPRRLIIVCFLSLLAKARLTS